MRFDDMVLKTAATIKGIRLFVLHDVAALDLTGVHEAQHEADMAYEVACLQAWVSVLTSHWDSCGLCGGTGRTTIGAIIAADRARKVATAK